MKKIVAALLVVAMAIFPVINIYAIESTDSNIQAHEEMEIEVIFPSNTAFNSEQQEMITNSFMNKDAASPLGLSFCWLVGHSYVTDTVLVVTHKVRTSSPRCLRETYNVTTCEKCDYYKEELINGKYIVCCPVD